MPDLNEPPHVWGSMWWQNPAGACFELRTKVTPRYVNEANASLPKDANHYLWLPVGEKPSPQAMKWADYGPPDP